MPFLHPRQQTRYVTAIHAVFIIGAGVKHGGSEMSFAAIHEARPTIHHILDL
jgi:hypothetical protein